jgi:hypothetical protein
MKRKVFSIIGIAAVTGVIAVTITTSLHNDTQLDIALANIEAIAQSEDGATIECTQSNCRGGKCHQSSYDPSCPCTANGYPGWTCNNWSGI